MLASIRLLPLLLPLACGSGKTGLEGDGGGGEDGGGDGGAGDGGADDGGSGDGGSGDGGSGDGGSGDGGSGSACDALPEPEGEVLTVGVGDVDSLASLLYDLAPGTTVLLEDGDYPVDGDLWILADGVTLRGESGNRDAVVLDAGYRGGSVISIAASDVTVAHLTLQKAWYHGVHVAPLDDGDLSGVLLYDIAVIDPGQQGIKVNSNGGAFVDEGEIACSRIALGDEGREQVRDDCYTGGIDAHFTRDWWVHDNEIEGFWCESGLSEHGIHFWKQNRGARVERNLVVNCARGIGLGLADSSTGEEREWEDVDCPEGVYVDDYEGLVQNNMIFADDEDLFASASGMDGGISLASACRSMVLHNTVWSTQAPFASIEYRFDGTTAWLANNLVSHDIMDRGVTSAALDTNLSEADPSLLQDPTGGDLHLRGDTSGAIDAGTDAGVEGDYDQEGRDDQPDIGADERVE